MGNSSGSISSLLRNFRLRSSDPSIFIALLFAISLALSSFWIDPYLAYVGTSWIIFGLLGLSLDLVWGRGGLLSLGQTSFYGIGGYVGSIAAINFAPLTGNSLIWALPFGAISGAILATLVGWFIFYGRMGSLQSTILTYTFTLIVWTITLSFTTEIGEAVVGGDNGMSNIPGFVLGFDQNASSLSPNMMFLTVIVISAIIYLIVAFIVRSPFGMVIDSIRLDAVKAELLGLDIRLFQTLMFMLAGAIAGIAGGLFGAWANYLNPSIFSVQEALLVPIYVLVGGLGTLIGPFVGALTVGGLSFWLGGGVIGGQTTLVMGACLIVLVIFLRKGIVGGIQTVFARIFDGSEVRDQRSQQTSQVRVNLDLLEKLQASAKIQRDATLKTVDTSKRFGGVLAVDSVSQVFEPGKVRCIIGPNGAGKSSYLKTCTGAYAPDSGMVLYSGQDITKINPFERVKLGLGIKMQTAQVFDELSVKQNLWIAGYGNGLNKERADQVSDEMLDVLNMREISTRLASTLSHGEQQWLDIGMVLCLAPSVILLDEPAAGMSKEEKRQLSELVRLMAKTATVVVVDHDMDFVRTLDAEVTVLHQGAVFAQAEIDELRKDERILDIYLGRRESVTNF